MAEAGGIDVLMRIVITSGSLAMQAESSTDFEPLVQGDPMMKDFTTGHFCELRNFDFSAGVEKLFKKTKEKKEEAPTLPKAVPSIVASVLRTQDERLRRREKDEFVDMQPVSYTRILDSASPLLLEALTKCTTLASISIVKRKATGNMASGWGYLRLDFKQVLLTALTWKDAEHVMIESGSFIYRELAIEYLTQKADGSLEAASSANWKMRATRTGS